MGVLGGSGGRGDGGGGGEGGGITHPCFKTCVPQVKINKICLC